MQICILHDCFNWCIMWSAITKLHIPKYDVHHRLLLCYNVQTFVVGPGFNVPIPMDIRYTYYTLYKTYPLPSLMICREMLWCMVISHVMWYNIYIFHDDISMSMLAFKSYDTVCILLHMTSYGLLYRRFVFKWYMLATTYYMNVWILVSDWRLSQSWVMHFYLFSYTHHVWYNVMHDIMNVQMHTNLCCMDCIHKCVMLHDMTIESFYYAMRHIVMVSNSMNT
jgi:hypothetical protein